MTAPLTPPPQQPPDNDPWQTHTGSSHPGPVEEVPAVKKDVRDAVLIALVVTLTGVVLGLLWLWLAPRVPLIADDKAVFLKDTEGEEAIGGDGTFILLALGLGALTAGAVFLFRRRGGIAVVLGLAVGALLGSVLAWRLGIWLGPNQDVVAAAKAAGKGVTFDAPLKLNAKGALLTWPFAAMAVHLGLTALFGPRDPEPEWVPGPMDEIGPLDSGSSGSSRP
ncbi:ABC transporter permease [Streptomyces sp. NBC_01431]|uniref:ABC transporter permease n=1 Tax=Streptomyces sp. NBC_01431 TaxID=2903863 RepID=UPI002E35748C|nr:ABC transporter permease [Streptomyces sp. NBC_01431]